MSIRIELQQSFGQYHNDPLARYVDDRADFLGQRHEHLSAGCLDDEPASAGISLDVLYHADAFAGACLDETTHQIVPVVGSRRQRAEPLDRNPQLQTGQGRRLIHIVHAVDANNRPLAVKSHARERDRLDFAATPDEQLRSGLKALIGEIGFRVDDYLTPNAVGARHSSDQRHLVPVHPAIRPLSLERRIANLQRHRLAFLLAGTGGQRPQRRRRTSLLADHPA
jgi:hypothetical protein